MSVILKALQAQKEGEKERQEKLPAGEGIFLGKRGFVTQEKKPLPKRIYILAAFFVVVATFSFTMIWFGMSPKTAPEPMVSLPPVTSLPVSLPPAVPATQRGGSAFGGEKEKKVLKSEEGVQARALLDEGRLDESLKLFQQALDKNPEDPLLQNDIGLLYIRKELYSSAQTHFTKALEIDSSCAECFNNLGYLKTLLGHAIEAEKYLKKSILLKSDYADPHFNLGVLYEKKGDIGEAVTSFKRFLELKGEEKSELIIQLKQHLKELTGK